MLPVTGILDGEAIVFNKPFDLHKKCKVIITFLDETDRQPDEAIRSFGTENDAFNFWNNSAEDLYQDYLDKK